MLLVAIFVVPLLLFVNVSLTAQAFLRILGGCSLLYCLALFISFVLAHTAIWITGLVILAMVFGPQFWSVITGTG